MVDLKAKIEKEIIEIDNLYEAVNSQVSKSFEIKHEKLLLEERNIKEKLQNEVTKVKEQLENFLSKANELIRINEKIEKGIKSFKKEEESIIKTLTYVSKINQNKNDMEILLNKLMKNLKISFIEEENSIKFEEYYFNGLQAPKDISFKEISLNSFKIFWKYEDINILNIDKNQIKYRVEMRKENGNENFVKIYEGNNDNCSIQNLNENTNYEIRICIIYNNIISNWTEIQKVKTKEFDSNILKESQKGKEFYNKILEWTGGKYMELLYRSSRDGTKSGDCHNKCDNQGPTICLFKNDKGNIFGGYSSISRYTGSYKSAPGSFIFTLSNIYNTAPTKFQNQNNSKSLYGNGLGVTFGSGHDIYVSEDFTNKNNSYCGFPYTYEDTLGKGKSIFTGDINSQELKIKEVEVFKVLK